MNAAAQKPEPAEKAPPILFPKVEQEEFFLQAIEAFDDGDTNRMLQLMDHAVAMDVTNHFAYIKRAQLYDLVGKNAEAARDYTRALGTVGVDKKYADVFQMRGCAFFKLGSLRAAMGDWATFIELKPDKEAEHWQICVALALLGKYSDAQRQFEWHWTANAKDMEVAFWHFLCVARTDGLEAAREKLMQVEEEKRVPMRELYRLFRGDGSAADVWLAVEEGDPNDTERNRREFFANYYLGLFHEAEGKLEDAIELVGAALGIAKVNEGYIGDSPGGQLRGGDIARVHLQQLERRLADQRAWEKAGQNRGSLGTKIAYVAAGVSLAALIGLGVAVQRKRRPPTEPVSTEPEPKPEELPANRKKTRAHKSRTKEPAGKSST